MLHDPELERLLGALHARSDEQVAAIASYHAPTADELKTFRRDKAGRPRPRQGAALLSALPRHQARRIVEVGTSHGVSTLYLAAAVRDKWRAAARW